MEWDCRLSTAALGLSPGDSDMNQWVDEIG
jgi:hypothetical protein